jgi:hypothetical protein
MKWRVAVITVVVLGLSLLLSERAKVASRYIQYRLAGKKTVSDRISKYGNAADSRLRPFFDKIGVAYPPAAVTLLAIKDQKQVELFARPSDGLWVLIRTYPIQAASGTLGPKLKEGDGQVPEGIYGIESLNPNSLYHLSLRLNYPNEFDRRMGSEDGRQNLGSDIMIHGSNMSIGCLAMGDEAAEDLFVLAARVGIKNVRVIISPVDFRDMNEIPDLRPDVKWTASLYQLLASEMKAMKKPNHGLVRTGDPRTARPSAQP